jgi:hypothetical protein
MLKDELNRLVENDNMSQGQEVAYGNVSRINQGTIHHSERRKGKHSGQGNSSIHPAT